MLNDNEESITEISRYIDGTPTVVNKPIHEGCLFENSLVGIGTMIIDKDFINEILSHIDEVDFSLDFMVLINSIGKIINNYFYSNDIDNKSREKVYDDSIVLNEEGEIIGTKLSSLKGKNVAKCSEKSVAAYIILEKLYLDGKITRKPALVISYLKSDNTSLEPHAFILIDKESDNYPTKHILYDPENPVLIEGELGDRRLIDGLFSLTDEEYENVLNGIECSPMSLIENLNYNYHDIGEKRIYGKKQIINNKTR